MLCIFVRSAEEKEELELRGSLTQPLPSFYLNRFGLSFRETQPFEVGFRGDRESAPASAASLKCSRDLFNPLRTPLQIFETPACAHFLSIFRGLGF